MTTPIGKYKLIKLIASGGMAEVYLAKQAGAAGFEKLVCLKRILPHLARDKQFVDMFLNEARLAAQLDHPNIVQIFDLGEANGNYFIAMEFIDGPNLRSIAKRATELGELLPVAEVVRVIAQAAGGLHYAHELTDPRSGQPLGLVHRDISPDNVLVHKNGSVKVVDFGIAKAANSSGATRTGTLKGKVAYMPPEQLRGEPLDRRVDVFALGVVMYELLAGKRPWEGTSEVALISQIMTTDPQPLAELRPDAPPELLAVIERALSKDRDQRYQTCQELQLELEDSLLGMGQTVTAARVAEFVRYYAPEPHQQGSATTGVDQADLSAVEEHAFGGTGAAPAVVGPHAPAAPAAAQDAGQGAHGGTQLMDDAALPPKGGAWKYGVGAFVAIAALGAGAFYFFMPDRGDDTSQAVAVERSSIPVEKAPEPPKAVELPKAVEPPKSAEPAKVEEKKADPAPAPKKRERKVAVKDPAPEPPKVEEKAPPVVIVEKPPEPKPQSVVIKADLPAPVVTAKGELSFLIRPWAEVHVDGKKIGISPLPPLQLEVGEHQVRLINRDLGKDVTRTVVVTANGREQVKEIFEAN